MHEQLLAKGLPCALKMYAGEQARGRHMAVSWLPCEDAFATAKTAVVRCRTPVRRHAPVRRPSHVCHHACRTARLPQGGEHRGRPQLGALLLLEGLRLRVRGNRRRGEALPHRQLGLSERTYLSRRFRVVNEAFGRAGFCARDRNPNRNRGAAVSLDIGVGRSCSRANSRHTVARAHRVRAPAVGRAALFTLHVAGHVIQSRIRAVATLALYSYTIRSIASVRVGVRSAGRPHVARCEGSGGRLGGTS